MQKRDRPTPSNTHGKASALATAATLEQNNAALASAWCALSARCDGRQADYRFWFRVFESHFPRPPEQAEIYATVMRERPEIRRRVDKMAKQLRGLSDVSQKQAIVEFTACWILAIYPESLELALALSDKMREQTDINLTESKKPSARH